MSKPKNTVSKRDTLAGLVQFGFEGEPVRMVMEGDMPWFNANDACRALGYVNPRDAVADHVDDEDVAKRDTLTRGGKQQVNFVNESGLYALIFGSGKPKAKRFKRWVTSDVLPSIRRSGQYGVGESALPAPAKQDDEFALTPAFFARLYYALGKQLGPAAVVWHLARLGSLQDWVTISLRELSRGMDHWVGQLRQKTRSGKPVINRLGYLNGIVRGARLGQFCPTVGLQIASEREVRQLGVASLEQRAEDVPANRAVIEQNLSQIRALLGTRGLRLGER